MEINENLAKKVLETVNAGLVKGVGVPTPGKMCVEAAVCYAMGLEHSDNPTCVGPAVRAFKIRLNDSNWSSNKARAEGLRKLAIAQLGSEDIDQTKFVKIVVEQTIRQIVPRALRIAKKRNPKHADALEAAAVECEINGNRKSALNARKAAADAGAYYAASAAAYTYDAAYYTAPALPVPVPLVPPNGAAAADAAASAASAAADYAYAAVYAAVYAADAASAASAAADEILNLSCAIGLAALIELKSPGCEFLYLIEEGE